MVIWEIYSLRFKILFIILILYFVLFFIFWCLIKFKKIKPNKITRFFYEDDEQFIKKWEKERNKGKIIYIFSVLSKFYVFYILGMLFFFGFDLSVLRDKWPIFLGSLIGYTIGIPVGWAVKEDKYLRLIKNMNTNKKQDDQSGGEDIDG
jgi:amino acid transporter